MPPEINFVLFVSPPLFCSYRCGWHAMRIGSGDCNMHAIQHECAMRCIQPHVVHVNPCTLPLPLPMNSIACNMMRADGCKHHLYPARKNKKRFVIFEFHKTKSAKSVHCLSAAACGWGQRHSRFELFPPTAAIPRSPGDRRSFPRKHSACHIFESGGCE